MTDGGLGSLWEREAECAQVADVLKAAAQGQGGMLLVEGPAGIGKSRLLAEARAQAKEKGVRTVVARAGELERDFAFGIVRQLFEPLIMGPDADEADGLWAGPAAQARPVFESADQPTAGPTGDFAVLHGLYWLAANACQHRPLLLLIDDLQWCDVPSLRFLTYLLPRLDDLSLLLACARRTGEPAPDERLLARLTTDPAVHPLHPAPLSEQAGTRLLAQSLTGPVEAVFAAACHEATGGNPLLLHALARTLTDEHLAPTAANAHRVAEAGAHGVAHLTAARMARLPETARALARAVAILGDRADLTTAAALSGEDTTIALESATELELLEILRIKGADSGPRLSFVHPLVRAAVYDTLDMADRARWHRNAAHLLADAAADPERIAAHLQRTPPAGAPENVATLLAAATAATDRGAPGSTYTHLKRALAEPPPAEQRWQVLRETGLAALNVDLQAAAAHLQQAYDQTTDPVSRADLAIPLGAAYHYLRAPDHCLAIWSQALDQTPAPHHNLRRRLQAALLGAATWAVPGRPDILDRLNELLRLPSDDSTGARLLDCAIASREMAIGDPASVSRARRALADPALIEEANGEASLAAAWAALQYADDDQIVMDSIQAAVEQAHRTGSLYALTPVYNMRTLGWLNRGQLAEAENSARETLRTAALASDDLGGFFTIAFLADILTEQGRLEQAEQTLAAIGVTPTAHPPGPIYLALTVLSRLQAAHGDHQGALNTAGKAGDLCRVYDIRNPAVVPWRSEAALALYALNRVAEARALATEELELARHWGAPRTLGRALRVAGLVAGAEQGLELLREAVIILENSPARLEYAKALADLGAALRRAGKRTAARTPLRRALELATQCGATPVADFAYPELAAAGGRPRHTALTGPDALTPSERRIAELAATGATNRQIAQRLYVTPKTVEAHLSSAYRKLGVTARTQLPQAPSRPETG